jgi:hypothetical protein
MTLGMPLNVGRASVRLLSGVALVCAPLGLSGCQSIVANTPDAAEVRFVDTSLDAPAVDVYVNGTGVAFNLGYATFSSYVPVTPGSSQISATKANTGQTLVAAHAALAGAHQYTAVVSNRLGSLEENIYPDVAPAVVPGTLSVRVLDAAEAGAVDVYLLPPPGGGQATAIAKNLGYPGDAGYEHIPAGVSYTVLAVPAGAAPTTANALAGSGVTVSGAPGAARTVVLSEAQRGEAKRMYAFVLDDFETP